MTLSVQQIRLINHLPLQGISGSWGVAITTDMYALLVRTTRLVIVYLSSVALSSANIQVQQMNTTFITGKAVSTSHTSLQKYSKAQLVKTCLEEGKIGACSIAGYNEATRICYLSTDSEDDVVDIADEMADVFVLP